MSIYDSSRRHIAHPDYNSLKGEHLLSLKGAADSCLRVAAWCIFPLMLGKHHLRYLCAMLDTDDWNVLRKAKPFGEQTICR